MAVLNLVLWKKLIHLVLSETFLVRLCTCVSRSENVSFSEILTAYLLRNGETSKIKRFAKIVQSF